MPYFFIEWSRGGMAHIIEDAEQFPHDFGSDIVAGMIGESLSVVVHALLPARPPARTLSTSHPNPSPHLGPGPIPILDPNDNAHPNFDLDPHPNPHLNRNPNPKPQL